MKNIWLWSGSDAIIICNLSYYYLPVPNDSPQRLFKIDNLNDVYFSGKALLNENINIYLLIIN